MPSPLRSESQGGSRAPSAPPSEARNTFSREVNGRTARARHLARTPSRLDQRVRLEDAAKDLPEKTNLATSCSLYSPAEIHRARNGPGVLPILGHRSDPRTVCRRGWNL